ncbi:thioredoxin-like protein [Gautieria morchelliformis]|nr:thioredoxin-like protein [Gautieria morchelliformis]
MLPPIRPLLTLRVSPRAFSCSRRTFSVTTRSRQQIHDADEITFKSHISNTKDKVILVDFYEDWCPPCKVLSPLLERLEGDPSLIGAQSLDLVTIKGESVPNLALEYKIRAVPTVFAFRNGSVIGKFTGALSLPQIKSWFTTLMK